MSTDTSLVLFPTYGESQNMHVTLQKIHAYGIIYNATLCYSLLHFNHIHSLPCHLIIFIVCLGGARRYFGAWP